MKLKTDVPLPCGAWHLGFYGPRFVDVHQFFGEKAVVASTNSPEVVNVADLYANEKSCFSAAAVQAMSSVSENMRKAADYSTHAASIE